MNFWGFLRTRLCPSNGALLQTLAVLMLYSCMPPYALGFGFIPGRLLCCSVVPHGLHCSCLVQDLSASCWGNSSRFLPGLLASLVTNLIFSTLGQDTQGSLRPVSHQILQLKLLLPLTVNLTLWWLLSPKTLLVATLPAHAHKVSPAWSALVLLLDLMNCFSFKFQFKCHLLSANSLRE